MLIKTPIMDEIKITSVKSEMAEIGKNIIEEKSEIYTEDFINILLETIDKNLPEASDTERLNALYCSIYDYWVYGNNISEEFYYQFPRKSHEEKKVYLTQRNKFVYFWHLSKKEDAYLLENKWETYKLLKPYFKREMIELRGESDEEFEYFLSFISRHPIFMLKPLDMGDAHGVERIDSNDFSDKHALYKKILTAGKEYEVAYRNWKQTSVVLEELIVQSEEFAKIHPASVQTLRFPVIRINGKIHVYHPYLKVGVNNGAIANELGGFTVGVNPVTGITDTDGYIEKGGEKVEIHPNTNIPFMGIKLPHWDELQEFVEKLMDKLPTINYVGWELVYTSSGWVVIEGNYYGEPIWQMVYHEGTKPELEELIGWKPESEFWWQN